LLLQKVYFFDNVGVELPFSGTATQHRR